MQSERLRRALDEAGLTGTELAAVLGVSRGYVSQWLNGHRDVPEKYVEPIVLALKVDKGWLSGGSAWTSHSVGTGIKEVSVGNGEGGLDDPSRDGSWSFREAPEDGGRDYGSANIWTIPADLQTLVRETGQNTLDHAVKLAGQVHMRFSLIELNKGSDSFEKFMKAVHFDGLRGHLERAAGTRSKLATRLRGGLKRLDQLDTIRLLRIEDYGTTGLFGDEATGGPDENNPFASLVRNNLDSSKQTTTAGGSFGLGKAVLWRCSDLSTVLFSSQITGPKRLEGQPDGVRFIGKSELTWHALDDEAFAGPGWLGVKSGHQGGRSMWVDNEHLDALFLSRAAKRLPAGVEPARASGTSILILAFQDPEAEEDLEPSDLLRKIEQAAAENFWPVMMDRERLRVSTEYLVDGEVRESRQVDPMDDVFALCDAFSSDELDEVEDDLAVPGDVVRVNVVHRVPATAEDATDLQPFRNELDASAKLLVRLAKIEESDSEQINTVALVRGRGMVVRYWPRKNIVVGAPPFHAVLFAGRWAGADAPQTAADQFLRLAEPPAHNRWEFNAEVKEKYERGAGARLKELHDAISASLGRVLKPRQSRRNDGPDELKRLLQIAASPPSPPPPATLRRVVSHVEEQRWGVQGEIHMNDRTRRRGVTPRLRIDAESGEKVRIPWEKLDVEVVGRGAAEVVDGTIVVAPNTRRVRFQAASASEADGVAVAECRVRLDLRVTDVSDEEGE